MKSIQNKGINLTAEDLKNRIADRKERYTLSLIHILVFIVYIGIHLVIIGVDIIAVFIDGYPSHLGVFFLNEFQLFLNLSLIHI